MNSTKIIARFIPIEKFNLFAKPFSFPIFNSIELITFVLGMNNICISLHFILTVKSLKTKNMMMVTSNFNTNHYSYTSIEKL